MVKVLKKEMLLAVFVGVMIIVYSASAISASLPSCAYVAKGSEACNCKDKATCQAGQACVKSTITSWSAGTAGGGSYTSTTYSCVSADDAKNSSSSEYHFGGGSSTSVSIVSREETVKTQCKSGSETSCMPYCKYTKVDECFLCPVFTVVFNAVSDIGETAVTSFSNSVVRVVVIGFGIWLAIQILLFASSPETRDLKDLLQSIIIQSFLIVVVVAIIETGVGNFFKTFVNPVYETGQSMAQTMFDADTCDVAASKEIECSEEDTTVAKKPFEKIKSNPNSLPQSMGVSILRTMTMMENRVSQFKALGSSLMCQSWKDGFFIIPKPIYLITGLAIWALSMALIIGIPFLMVDSVFQLGVAVTLLPMAVGSFAFKSTRQYSKKVWETVLNSMFSFLFISVVVIIILGTIQYTVTTGMENVSGSKDGFNAMFNPDGAGETFYEAILENFSWTTMHFLRLVFVFVLAWSVMNMGKEFAGEFADSISSTSIGSSIGTMAASSAKGMAVKAGKPMLAATGKGLSKGVQRMARGARHGVRRGWNAATQAWKFRNAQDDGKGGKTYTDKKGGVHTLKNGVETIESKDKTVIKTKNMTLVRTKSIVNGKEVYHDEVKLNNDKLHKILRQDGTINAKELSTMLEGVSGEQRKLMQSALTKAVIEQRFSRSAHQYGSAKVQSSEITTDGNGKIVVKEVDINGRVTFSEMKMNDNGYLETSVTTIDKDGRVRSFSSDGVRNKMESYELEKGTDAKSLKDVEGVKLFQRKDQKAKVSYGYTKYWQQQVDRGLDENKIPLGAMSAEEVYGENIITDKNGNIIGKIDNKGFIYDGDGNVVARRTSIKADIRECSVERDKDGNIISRKDGEVISKYGDYKTKRRGGAFSDFVGKEGNEFQKGDMEFYFR